MMGWGRAGVRRAPPAPSYSFPPGGLQGGFELPGLSPRFGDVLYQLPTILVSGWGLVPGGPGERVRPAWLPGAHSLAAALAGQLFRVGDPLFHQV